MDNFNKGRNPFYPGQPVPVEFFIGRIEEIEHITRSIKQVELGKTQAIFLTGEYGIGKSSLAGALNYYAEKNHNIIGIHVFLGGAKTLEEIAEKTVEAVIKQQLCQESKSEKIRNFFSKYIGQQNLFGFNLNFQELKSDALNISRGFLPFLKELFNRFKNENIKGIMLILDEINGITQNPQFSHFIKSLVDENALSRDPLPLLLMLCGVEERRREMILHHQPIERIFEIIEIVPMNINEMIEFFTKAFQSVGVIVEENAMKLICHFSAGFPKLMHIIGDKIFWKNQDNIIDKNDAFDGLIQAAYDVGSKFIDQQVYKALKSKIYKSILIKLAEAEFDLSFKKAEIEKKLSEPEKKNFHNFLPKMIKLGLLKKGEERGEYIFTSRLTRIYINFTTADKFQKD